MVMSDGNVFLILSISTLTLLITSKVLAFDCLTIPNPMVATPTEDLNVTGVPRPSRNGAGFQNTAFHAAGRYTLTVDVIDGVRCFGYNLPSHDVYDWDATSLSGTITSTFDAGCAGAPGGTNVYLFSLNPM